MIRPLIARVSDTSLEGVIRRWGTKDKGLGFLKRGPTSETILDTPATVTLHPLAIVAVQDVEQAAWEQYLS